MRLELLISEYLLAAGYRLIKETEAGGLWSPPADEQNELATRLGVEQVMSFDWAVKHCLEREHWLHEIERFLAEQ